MLLRLDKSHFDPSLWEELTMDGINQMFLHQKLQTLSRLTSHRLKWKLQIGVDLLRNVMKKMNEMILMTWCQYPNINQWMRIGGSLSKKLLMILLEQKHLVRSQLRRPLFCLLPSAKGPTKTLQQLFENTIQKLLRRLWRIWHQSLPNLVHFRG